MRYDIATERTKLTERFRDTKLAVTLARAFGSEAAFLMRIDEAAANGTFDGLFAAKLCLPLLDDTQIDEKRLVRLAYDALTERLYPTEEGLSLTQAQHDAVELFLDVCRCALAREEGAPFDPLRAMRDVDDTELSESAVAGEYRRFQKLVYDDDFLILLRICRDATNFDTGAHVLGVHNLALHFGRLLALAGVATDLPLLSAAALSHDVGKFGCRGDELPLTPHLHYYYTHKWLVDGGMERIAHIAANHSTWDLEFENLTVESLLLIYADFRVRGFRDEAGKEHMRFVTLNEGYRIILSKLANVDEAKRTRYALVFSKLKDFEGYMRSLGIGDDAAQSECMPVSPRYAALLTHEEAAEELRLRTVESNIRIMHYLASGPAFERLLESVRNASNLDGIRTYLRTIEEYVTYMSRANKLAALELLYELLMHHAGDVRRQAGRIMGRILANSGPGYRKRLPAAVSGGGVAPALDSILVEGAQLWRSYLDKLIKPDHKISQKHAARIQNSLRVVTESLFSFCEHGRARLYARVLVEKLCTAEPTLQLLYAAAFSLPVEYYEAADMEACAKALVCLAESDQREERICAACCYAEWESKLPDALFTRLRELLPQSFPTKIETGDAATEADIAAIFLSDLKNAVHWTIKLCNIELLCGYAQRVPEQAFHVAMHLANVLCVSEHLPAREAAGKGLMRISDLLTVDQRNEIVVDLSREIETGQYEVSKFIGPYLGRLILGLPEKETDEAVEYLEQLLRSSLSKSARAALLTLGAILGGLAAEADFTPDTPLAQRLIGLLLTGVAHFREEIHRVALLVLCREIFANAAIPQANRRAIFTRIVKKLLTLLDEPREETLTRYNTAAMLNHLYRFATESRVLYGDFAYPAPRPAAFFPGTFDPFSLGHKRITQELTALGFETFLAIDEFSWSKRTLPKLQRRKIAQMAAADCIDACVFPDEIPVNLANHNDLRLLKSLFPKRELYLVVGSDVVAHASAYRDQKLGGVADYNHVLFLRESESAPLPTAIRGKTITLSLPAFYEDVSSTRIRESIDKDLDISMLVDPVVQEYIYEYGFYLRSPQYKELADPMSLRFLWERGEAALSSGRSTEKRSIRLVRGDGEELGCISAHAANVDDLFDELSELPLIEYVRERVSGKLLVIDALTACGEREASLLLLELCARSLSDNYTYALAELRDEGRQFRDCFLLSGYESVPDTERTILFTDMRFPIVLINDVLQHIKEPHRSAPLVRRAIDEANVRLRRVLTELYPGKLLLSFEAELLNDQLTEAVQRHNGVGADTAEGVLGPKMCVPYGKILANKIIPHTVTKTLHANKQFHANIEGFDITEYPGYSTLQSQIKTIRSFDRPVILVDDLLHNGYRMEKLDPLFKREELTVDEILVGILSGKGKDLMRQQNRKVDCVYFIPNMRYWFTESLLYPFLGGDSVESPRSIQRLPSSINLILPYKYPSYIHGTSEKTLHKLSHTALVNAKEILTALEKTHLTAFSKTLDIKRLSEAIYRPRLPDKGAGMEYNRDERASAYLEEDLLLMRRIGLYREETPHA